MNTVQVSGGVAALCQLSPTIALPLEDGVTLPALLLPLAFLWLNITFLHNKKLMGICTLKLRSFLETSFCLGKRSDFNGKTPSSFRGAVEHFTFKLDHTSFASASESSRNNR